MVTSNFPVKHAVEPHIPLNRYQFSTVCLTFDLRPLRATKWTTSWPLTSARCWRPWPNSEPPGATASEQTAGNWSIINQSCTHTQTHTHSVNTCKQSYFTNCVFFKLSHKVVHSLVVNCDTVMPTFSFMLLCIGPVLKLTYCLFPSYGFLSLSVMLAVVCIMLSLRFLSLLSLQRFM